MHHASRIIKCKRIVELVPCPQNDHEKSATEVTSGPRLYLASASQDAQGSAANVNVQTWRLYSGTGFLLASPQSNPPGAASRRSRKESLDFLQSSSA